MLLMSFKRKIHKSSYVVFAQQWTCNYFILILILYNRLHFCPWYILQKYWKRNWFRWPHGLRCGSVAGRLVRLWFGIPPGAWMSVSCECCVLSGRGLCVGPITRPEESYRLWCVWVWSWSLDNEEALAQWGLLHHGVGGGGTANEHPVQLNKCHMCLETAWYPFVIKMMNQVLVSALKSLSVIAGNNPAILPEKKSMYAKCVFSCCQDKFSWPVCIQYLLKQQ